MKKFITVISLMFTVSSFAGFTSYSGSLKVISTISEADMVLKAEALIPSILNFTNKEIRRQAGYKRCGRRPRDIRMQSLSVKKIYKSVDGETLEPVYLGSLGYILRNCRDRN